MRHSKIDNKFLFYLIIIFLVVQIIGLLTASYYSNQNIQLTIVTDNPNDIINAFAIIVYIIFYTGIILLLSKIFKKGRYLYFLEFLVLFLSTSIVFSIFLPTTFAYFFSLILLIIRKELKDKKYKHIKLWLNNILLGIAIAGSGSLIGLSLGIIPVCVFLILLSLYDIIAVFYTKHMITLAKLIIKKKLAFSFSIPSKTKIFQLGGGDLVIPLALSSSLFSILIKRFSLFVSLIPIICIWITSLIGLFLTFYILNKTKLKALPALPLQTILMLLVVLLTYIIMF